MKKLETVALCLLICVFILAIAFITYCFFAFKTSYASAQVYNYSYQNNIEKISDIEEKEPENQVVEVYFDPIIEETPEYYIKVNVAANTITVYKRNIFGEYTIPVKAFVCSTGTATPHSGVYKTPNKFRWIELLGSVYGQYSTQIVGHILFHSVPYRRQSKNSLIYSYYDKLGTKASAGCVRLTVEDAKWIYDNCILGTCVEFYDDADNPGPLGKPTAQKISGNVALRNWDPTDPDEDNPWHK